MAKSSKPRKKYIPKPVYSHYISADTVNQIRDLLNHVALSVELKLAQGKFSLIDFKNLKHFTNWVGFELAIRGNNDPDAYDEAQQIQVKLATAIASMHKRNKSAEPFIANAEELKAIREGVAYLLDPMKELLHQEPYSFLKEYKAFKRYIAELEKGNSPSLPRGAEIDLIN